MSAGLYWGIAFMDGGMDGRTEEVVSYTLKAMRGRMEPRQVEVRIDGLAGD